MFVRSLLGCFVAVVGYCVSAQAAIIDVTYTGTIYNDVSKDVGGMFGASGASLNGKAISVTYAYDTSLSPITAGPGNNQISGATWGVDITINGITHSIGGQYSSLVLNYNDGLGSSHVRHEAADNAAFTQYITIQLTDNVTGSLPKNLLAPYDFSGPNGTGFFRFDSGTLALFTPAHVTAVEVAAAVPEPSTWAMMILGFAGIGFIAYRRTRNGSAFAAA